MRILGVHIGHDASACLVEDGEVKRYIQEERYTRIKSVMAAPINSLKFALNNKDMTSVDTISMPTGFSPSIRPSYDAIYNKYADHVPTYLRDSLYSIDKDSVNYISHHYCHAASSYYTSGFNNCLIVTIDGIGETITQNVSIGKDGQIIPQHLIGHGIVYYGKNLEKTKKIKSIYSWGFFYSMATEALGWRTLESEGKTMGLAPYGKYNAQLYSQLRKLMYKFGLIGFWNIAGVSHHHYAGADKLIGLINRYGREDFAYNVQRLFEDRIIRFIRFWMKQTGQTKLCVAGGCFLNMKLNQRIREEVTKDFWVFPLANDAGLAVGAGLGTYYKENKYTPKRLESLYWGDEFSDEYILNILKRNKVKYATYDVKKTAKLLADNRIIARFVGRMEAGPRALGNRSILMSPLNPKNKDIINAYVKFREPFRPFCPSVTEERAKDYFDYSGKFMIEGANVVSKAIPAVTHVDGTARPQAVSKKVNKSYYELISEFGKLTGHPVLINTSFNVKGEPIIHTPEEAIRCFYGTGLDGMIIGKYFILKEGA